MVNRENSLNQIIYVVARQCGIAVTDLKQRGRTQKVALARQIAMYLGWNYEGNTLNEIGKALGNRSPATVSHGYQVIAKALPADKIISVLIENIKKELGS